MKYSTGMRQTILKRVIPSANESVAAVSRGIDVRIQTIYYWKQARDGTVDAEGSKVKPRIYRKNARKNYCAIAKERKPDAKGTRKAIGKQRISTIDIGVS